MSYTELIKELETRFLLDNQTARVIVAIVTDWIDETNE